MPSNQVQETEEYLSLIGSKRGATVPLAALGLEALLPRTECPFLLARLGYRSLLFNAPLMFSHGE
jgi:hypothetical protein